MLKEHGYPIDAHLLWRYIKEKFSESRAVQDSKGADYLTKPVRLVWLTQLTQDFSKRSAINQIKIQLLKLALCLLQVIESAL
jgi:hypothetical protein